MHTWTGVSKVNINWIWDPNCGRLRKDKSDGRNGFPYSDGRIENDGSKVRDISENMST